MKKVYEILQELDTNFPSCAICAQVMQLMRNNPSYLDWIIYKDQAFRSWPKFSGKAMYPVPFKAFGILPVDPETAYYNREKWAGRYGRDRRELVVHLIQWFKERDL